MAARTKPVLSRCSLPPGQPCLVAVESQMWIHSDFALPGCSVHHRECCIYSRGQGRKRQMIQLVVASTWGQQFSCWLSYQPPPSFLKADQGKGLVSWWQLRGLKQLLYQVRPGTWVCISSLASVVLPAERDLKGKKKILDSRPREKRPGTGTREDRLLQSLMLWRRL